MTISLPIAIDKHAIPLGQRGILCNKKLTRQERWKGLRYLNIIIMDIPTGFFIQLRIKYVLIKKQCTHNNIASVINDIFC